MTSFRPGGTGPPAGGKGKGSKPPGGSGKGSGPGLSSQNISFYVRIEPLRPEYSDQNIHSGGHWEPPTVKSAYSPAQGATLFFRWEGGRVFPVPAGDSIRTINLNNYIYRTATVFTQQPDTPYVLAVPFDARHRNVRDYGGGWRPCTFDHIPIGSSNAYYSYVSALGAEQKLAAPGSSSWMPQLLDPWFQCHAEDRGRQQAGLIGNLPMLFALAAFSTPPTAPQVLQQALGPGAWNGHAQPSGHIAERGMVVTIYFDPRNPIHSTKEKLDQLQQGVFGPFYGP